MSFEGRATSRFFQLLGIFLAVFVGGAGLKTRSAAACVRRIPNYILPACEVPRPGYLGHECVRMGRSSDPWPNLSAGFLVQGCQGAPTLTLT